MADKTGIEWTDATWRRFVSQIDQRGPDECWPWKAGLFSNGYGQARVGKRKVRAHRAHYERVVGPVPDGKILRHSCDNRICCNPRHLIPGTHLENADDRDSRGRNRSVPPPGRPGNANPAARLTLDQVREIRARAAAGEFQRSIASAFGMSQSQVGNIIRGKCWRESHVG